MSTPRMLLNGVVAFCCFSGGVSLLARGSFFLRDRWHPETGTYFSGVPLYLLAFGLFFLGAFAVAVARAWMMGAIPLPDLRRGRPRPDYKGRMIARYWYIVAPALILVLGAFMLAKHAPNPSFHPVLQNSAVQLKR